MFHGVGTDIAGNEADFTIPMMFVSRRETSDTCRSLRGVQQERQRGRSRGP